jgi:spore germination cell wall hydrolase CwlJ-like protein
VLKKHARQLALSFFTLLLLLTSTISGTNTTLPNIQEEVEKHHISNILIRQANHYREIDCLARNVYYESRGESWDGQLAVAMVTLNRVESDRFPNSVCAVVNERYKVKNQFVCQFSWRCEIWNNPQLKVNREHISYKVAEHAIQNYHLIDLVTPDTLWFHATYVKPKWRKFKERVARIDTHIFYRMPGEK